MAAETASFYARSREARKILVLDLGFLGDSVHLVPPLWDIRQHYPNAQLHTLSAPVGREVLAMAPCVDQARAFPLGGNSPPWWRHWDILQDLRRERYEAVINFSGADRTLFMMRWTGARWRLAQERGRHHFYNRWLAPDRVSKRAQTVPVYEQRRQVLAEAGFKPGPVIWNLQVPRDAEQRAAELVPDRAVHLSLNASSSLREWPMDRWIELSKRWLAKDPSLTLVASGSPSTREQARLQALAIGVADRRLVRLPPDLSIAHLAGALRRCRLHIGSDSGVLHLAVALGVPTISFFRDSPVKAEWLPRGPEHQALVMPCECVGRENPPCGEMPRCLAAITPDQVLSCAGAGS